MMSSVSEMLEAINKVNNNRKAMGEWKKKKIHKESANARKKKKKNLKRTLGIGI